MALGKNIKISSLTCEEPRLSTGRDSTLRRYPRTINQKSGIRKEYAIRTIPFKSSDRRISTPRLNTLLCFHLAPINVVISHEPQTIPYLGVGFPLRCFQRLSNPDIATGRCTWRYSPQTRGQFISVLSSFIPRFLGAQTISSPFSDRGRVAASYPYEQSVSRTDSSTHESSTECLVVTGSLWTSLRTRRANPRCRVENMLTASGLQSPES